MPVWNGARFLCEGMDSILAQTFTDFEFLVVDDGSADETPDILARYAIQDRRVRILTNERNLGLIASLNKGLAAASGELIARMDADDVAYPERIQRQVDYLGAHPDCVAVGCRILSIDAEGLPIRRERQSESHDGIEWVYFRGLGGMPHPGVTFRRQAAVDIGGYQEQFPAAEDVDFFLRLAEHGKLANLPLVLLKYRRHAESVCGSNYERQRQSAEAAVKAACQRRGIPVPADFAENYPPLLTRFAQHLEWSRQAAWDGFPATAWRHSITALRMSPTSGAVWKALVRVGFYGIRSLRGRQ